MLLVWTLGELARRKRLFNPPPQFSRLGTWCPAFVYMYGGGLSSFYPRRRVTVVVVCVYLSVPALADSASVETSKQWYSRISLRLVLD